MARIAGVDLDQNKQVGIALTKVYGIGRHKANTILSEANIKVNKMVRDLDNNETGRLNSIIEKNHKVEGELRQDVFRDIKRLKDNGSYRGLRHKNSLPVRGQKTRTNAVTRKGKNIAVGGLNRALEKK